MGEGDNNDRPRTFSRRDDAVPTETTTVLINNS